MMPVTGACAQVVYLPDHVEPDYERPVANEEIVAAVEDRLHELPEDERIDEPVSPCNAFGI
jgi:hypothetical protein